MLIMWWPVSLLTIIALQMEGQDSLAPSLVQLQMRAQVSAPVKWGWGSEAR